MGEALYLFGPPVVLFFVLGLLGPGRPALLGFLIATGLVVMGFLGLLPICPPEGLFSRARGLSCDVYAQVPLRFSVAVMIWVGGAQLMRWRRLRAGHKTYYAAVLAGFWALIAAVLLLERLGG